MVWDGGLEPLVVPKRWDLLRFSLGRARVWMCGTGLGFMGGSFGMCLCVTYEEVWVYNVTGLLLL